MKWKIWAVLLWIPKQVDCENPVENRSRFNDCSTTLGSTQKRPVCFRKATSEPQRFKCKPCFCRSSGLKEMLTRSRDSCWLMEIILYIIIHQVDIPQTHDSTCHLVPPFAIQLQSPKAVSLVPTEGEPSADVSRICGTRVPQLGSPRNGVRFGLDLVVLGRFNRGRVPYQSSVWRVFHEKTLGRKTQHQTWNKKTKNDWHRNNMKQQPIYIVYVMTWHSKHLTTNFGNQFTSGPLWVSVYRKRVDTALYLARPGWLAEPAWQWVLWDLYSRG